MHRLVLYYFDGICTWHIHDPLAANRLQTLTLIKKLDGLREWNFQFSRSHTSNHRYVHATVTMSVRGRSEQTVM